MANKLSSVEDLNRLRTTSQRMLAERAKKIEVRVHLGTCGIAGGAKGVQEAFVKEIESRRLSNVVITAAACIGPCEREPVVTVVHPQKGKVIYANLTPEQVPTIVERHLIGGQVVDEWTLDQEAPTFKLQEIRVMHNQDIDPRSIEEYVARDGYQALAKALNEMQPEEVIDEVNKAGLRGRGGAGFPTGTKWGFVRRAAGDEKFVVCNGDEGDPGAYMNRAVLEGNPHSIIEGMAIGAYAIGNVRRGFAYVRAEYPLAIETLNHALDQARQYGLLGKNILGTGFEFDITVFPGAGAFVCGEETALLASIEGKRGNPRQRPPFPANKGLLDKPTTLNNVETWSNVPQIIHKGAEWFSSVGTEKSKGTKTFCLVGKINNTGLIEVPLGTSLGEIVFDIGGGIPDGRKFKAVQIGGPSGGCIPIEHLDTSVDYESVTALGAIMGSGGLIVMDENNCMVDVAKFYLGFTRDESCGKCTPCRAGIPKMLDTLTKVTEGGAIPEDVDTLRELAEMVGTASLCGLGQTAPNPVLTTLRHFQEEYKAHIIDKRCPAGICRALVAYHAIEDKCLPCLVSIAGYDAGGYESVKAILPKIIPERIAPKTKPDGCVVDLARFLAFAAQKECCAKCVPCRLGTAHMHNLLERIAAGNSSLGMLDLLGELSDTIKVGSQCPFGISAPVPILSLIKHFRDEFEEHIVDKHCPSGICKAPLVYHVKCPIYPDMAMPEPSQPQAAAVSG